MSEPHDEISIFEWITAALGSIMILAALAFIAYQGIASRGASPEIRVRAVDIERSGEGYLVWFTAENQGRATVAALSIEGRLLREGAMVETSEATIDYLPARSEKSGGLYFERDPGKGTLDLHPRGFTDP